MVALQCVTLALLTLQLLVNAAPSNTLGAVGERTTENKTLQTDSQPSPIEESKQDDNGTENQRQKRFYNHYGFGFPPINPVQYPAYNKRDQAADLGVYGIDDPISVIHRQIQNIASFARQPPPPPPVPVHFPIYFPVIFIPHCACNPDFNTPTAKPNTTSTDIPPTDGETTTPGVSNRWPEMEDERQNWGLVVNNTDEGEIGEDFSRPISFDPIVIDMSTSRPVPPVEHGSNQAGMAPGQGSTTTVAPNDPSNNDIPRPPQGAPPPPPSAPGAQGGGAFAASAPYPPSGRESPTTCDGAVLSCCHQPQITYDCFAVLGCPDPTSYGNPCDPLVILRVIGKYQRFYGARRG